VSVIPTGSRMIALSGKECATLLAWDVMVRLRLIVSSVSIMLVTIQSVAAYVKIIGMEFIVRRTLAHVIRNVLDVMVHLRMNVINVPLIRYETRTDPASATTSGQVKDAICSLASATHDVAQGVQVPQMQNVMNVYNTLIRWEDVVYAMRIGTLPTVVHSGVVLAKRLVTDVQALDSTSALSAEFMRLEQQTEFARVLLIGMTSKCVNTTKVNVHLFARIINALVPN